MLASPRTFANCPVPPVTATHGAAMPYTMISPRPSTTNSPSHMVTSVPWPALLNVQRTVSTPFTLLPDLFVSCSEKIT